MWLISTDNTPRHPLDDQSSMELLFSMQIEDKKRQIQSKKETSTYSGKQ